MRHAASSPALGSATSGRPLKSKASPLQPRSEPSASSAALPKHRERAAEGPASWQMPRRSPGAPSKMLQGLSPSAELQNSRVEGSMGRLQKAPGRLQKDPRRRNSTVSPTRRKSISPKWNMLRAAVFLVRSQHDDTSTELPLDEEDMVREMDDLAASISQLRKRHEIFQPINSKEAARQQLFGDAAERDAPPAQAACELSPDRGQPPRASGVKQLSPEAQLERFELLKYARKIEPEVPSLERPPPCREPPPNQAMVEFNASAAALQCWRPNTRSKLIATRSAKHTAHVRGVAKHAAEVKAAALARKREMAEQRSAGPARTALPNLRNAAGQWLAICAAASFMQSLVMDVRLKRLMANEQEAYISKNWQRLQRRRLPKRSATRELAKLVQLTQAPEFKKRLPLLECFFAGRLHIKRHREQAHQIVTCLNAWKSAGVMFLTLKRIGVHVKRLQCWWRDCLMRLKKIRNEVSRRWLAIEHNQLEQELRSLLPWAKPEDNPVFQAKIEKMRVPQAERLKFIEHELRARRFLLLPYIYLWEEDTSKWQKELQEWRATRRAMRVINDCDDLDVSAFHWPPARPSYLPNDQDIQKMWSTARDRPKGWTQIQRSAARGSRKGKQKVDEEVLVADDDDVSCQPSRSLHRPRTSAAAASTDEELEACLQRLGISPAFMPCGLVNPPPPTAECEDD